MKRQFKLIISLVLLFISILLLSFSYYQYQLSPVSKNDEVVKVQIPKAVSGDKIADILIKNKVIRSKFFFKVYLKLNRINNLKHGVYDIKQNMGTKKIIELLVKGTGLTGEEIDLLFREGINVREIARVIANNTNNKEEDIFNLLEDEEYIDTLINEYWFLTEDIKNKDLYYPLEGYLAPNTYRFSNEDVSVKQIFKTMLKQMDKVLSKYKEKIENSDFTIHEFITFASIVQGEGRDTKDMPIIAGVFYNRLEQKIHFQSCITNCYATKTDNCLPKKVKKSYNSPYNTYLVSMAGKLPVGPVSIPGEVAIEATVNPEKHDYLFFCADVYNNTYFSKTNAEHDQTVNKLKQEDKWPK
ncbi:MAG: endolytic transglycosylase MltG [Bacilli bacterium]|nr:endolytic transglycosylase MltG [Bacilli bacterium]